LIPAMIATIKEQLKKYPRLVAWRRRLRMLDFELADLKSSMSAWAPLQLGISGGTTPLGFKIFATTSVHHQKMLGGHFEPDEVNLLLELLSSADVFVDVGANIGYYVCLARHAGKHVVAIEPQAKNLRLLYKNVEANGYRDVEIFPMGVSDDPAMVTLFGPSGTGASMIPGWAGQWTGYKTVIPVTTLDILLGGRFAGKKLVVKIDVEGAEYRALLGAAGVLSREPRPTWMLEICLNEHHPNGINENYLATFDLFWRHGYQAFPAVPAGARRPIQRGEIESWVKERRAGSGVINYIFSPQL
jgi:FkbM family methyltransferase